MKISTLILTILVCFSTIVDAQGTQNRANELMKQAQSSLEQKNIPKRVIFSSKPMAPSRHKKTIRKPWNVEFRELLFTIVRIIIKKHSTSAGEWNS